MISPGTLNLERRPNCDIFATLQLHTQDQQGNSGDFDLTGWNGVGSIFQGSLVKPVTFTVLDQGVTLGGFSIFCSKDDLAALEKRNANFILDLINGDDQRERYFEGIVTYRA